MGGIPVPTSEAGSVMTEAMTGAVTGAVRAEPTAPSALGEPRPETGGSETESSPEPTDAPSISEAPPSPGIPVSTVCSPSFAFAGTWWSDAALVKVIFAEGASRIKFGFLDEYTMKGAHSEPGWTIWTWGADECCPDPTTEQDDWRWAPGVEPPVRCAGVASPADDRCASAHSGVTNVGVSPVTGAELALHEVCPVSGETGSEDAGAGGIGLDGGVLRSDGSGTALRRTFQFRATDAWSDFCAGAESVACVDVFEHTELDACSADYLCNYRYGEFGDIYADGEQVIDACASYAVCSCDAQGCAADPRFAWRYTFERQGADDLFARVSFVDTLAGSIVFESIGLTLRRLPEQL
jgi:hypothetical protein